MLFRSIRHYLKLAIMLSVICPLFLMRAFAAQEPNESTTLVPTSTTGVEVEVFWYEGDLVGIQGSGSLSDDGATVTVSAGGNMYSRKDNYKARAEVKNSSADKGATVTFDYSATVNGGQFTDPYGSTTTVNGSYSGILEPGASVSLEIYNKKYSATAATFTISNFGWEEAAETSKVTINYDSALGSVTADGTSVVDGGLIENVTVETGTVLVATPVSGATFLGWVDASNLIRSTAASYTLKPEADLAIRAVFVRSQSNAWFRVGNYMFDDLNVANTYAETATSKIIIPMYDGILPAGTYTITSGNTLLIPFDEANTCYTSAPECVDESWVQPTAYRTLTLATGANIVVEGAMSLSAKQSAKMSESGEMGTNGSPHGPVSWVSMGSNSNITVKNGGVLYVWGYITGSGTVTVKDGGTIHEDFQVTDWRGGTAGMGMLNNEQEVFPMSQYYVQNVEVSLTLEAGATEVGSVSVDLTGYGTKQLSVPFIGDEGMFRLINGSITKHYDGAKDILIVDVNGDVEIASMYVYIMTIQVPAPTLTNPFATKDVVIDIDSTKYVLPINGNITVNINTGSDVTVKQDISLLPGSQFNIAENASVVLETGYQLYVYDSADWGAYCYGGSQWRALRYAPGRTYTRTATDFVDAKIVVNGTVDASKGYVYTTDGGADICSTKSGVAVISVDTNIVNPYQATQSGTDISYVEIAVNPAWLKNADGCNFPYTMPELATANTETYGYTYTDGRWTCDAHTYDNGTFNADDGVKTYTCEACGHSYTESYAALVYTTDVSGGTYYDTVQSALDSTANNSAVTIRIFTSYEIVGTDGTFDLFGRVIEIGTGAPTGTVVTIASGTSVVDTKTSGFATTDVGSIPGNFSGISSYLGKKYLAISDGSTTSFHRVAASFNAYRVARASGLYYITVQGAFRGTDAAAAKLTSMGFVLIDDTNSKHTQYGGSSVTDVAYTKSDGTTLTETTSTQSTYLVFPATESDPLDAIDGIYYINYSFATAIDNTHTALCRVMLNGQTLDSIAHTTIAIPEL